VVRRVECVDPPVAQFSDLAAVLLAVQADVRCLNKVHRMEADRTVHRDPVDTEATMDIATVKDTMVNTVDRKVVHRTVATDKRRSDRQNRRAQRLSSTPTRWMRNTK